jgi:signal transduction histidine kinase/CheY-like chemotaxis protein
MMMRLLKRGSIDPSDQLIGTQMKEIVLNTLVVTAGAIGLMCYLVVNASGLGEYLPQFSLVLLMFALGSFAATRLATRNLDWAGLAWLLGLFSSLALLIWFFPGSNFYWLMSLLPLLALMVSFNWIWAIFMLLLVAGAGVALPGVGGFNTLLLVLLAAFLAAALVYRFAKALLLSTSYALDNYRRARSEVEETRQQRVELLQVQQDYFLANKELARLNEHLGVMTQYAEEAKQIKEEFVARVSHELRTPLNMVIGFSEIIMRSPQIYGEGIPPALLADIDAILRNSQHLAKLVDDILDLSQVEAGKMALTKEWVQFDTVIEEASAAVRGLAESKHLYLRSLIQANIPPIFCDSTRIRQVIINLLGNAARFTERGGIEIRVTLEQDHIQVCVEDTGSGIPDADQNRIFQPFHQVDSSLRKHKGGTGLGLTISKQFVEMHGGKMWLESKFGEGTTFLFTIPLRMAFDSESGLAQEAQRWFGPYNEYQPRVRPAELPVMDFPARYVLVEPEDTLHRLFLRYMDNVELVSVRSIDLALEEVSKKPVQGLILNVPSLDDEQELVEKIGHLPFGTPVLTCWVPGRNEAARELGVVEYLIKPIQRDDLVRVVQQVGDDVKRILLVDDEPEILRLFIRMLATLDRPYQVIQAPNGARALQLMRQRKPDMVILDLMMPEMDGFQVLHEKSHDERIRDIPVVVVSSLNPRGETTVSKNLSVSRGDGLSINELLRSIRALTKILVPIERGPDQESE